MHGSDGLTSAASPTHAPTGRLPGCSSATSASRADPAGGGDPQVLSFPARRLSIADRGEIREGMWADVVVFDERTVTEHATYAQPRARQRLLLRGRQRHPGTRQRPHTGAMPGRALRLT